MNEVLEAAVIITFTIAIVFWIFDLSKRIHTKWNIMYKDFKKGNDNEKG